MPNAFDRPTATAAIYLTLIGKSVVVAAQSASYPIKRFVPWDQNEDLVAAETLG